jgi:hypothetical protein
VLHARVSALCAEANANLVQQAPTTSVDDLRQALGLAQFVALTEPSLAPLLGTPTRALAIAAAVDPTRERARLALSMGSRKEVGSWLSLGD